MRRNRIEVPCNGCGAILLRTPGVITRNKDHYCSVTCRNDQQAKIEVPCTQCGKPLLRNPYIVKTLNKYFCNRVCQREWYAHRHDAYVVNRVCKQCGADFVIGKWFADHGKGNFCNAKCMGMWNSANKTGENHPQWKGGSLYDYGPNWDEQRNAVRERDAYTCQHCGKTEKKLGKELDVHHIQPFRFFTLVGYIEANDLANLICLCRKCHRRAEYGKIAFQPKLL